MKHEFFTTTGRSVDTAGWDTVSAIHIGELNNAIRLAKTSPSDFSEEADKGVHVSADFGDWNILPDSDGPILSMEMPLKNLCVTEGRDSRTYDTARAMVDVHLELLPHDPDNSDDKQLHILVVKLTQSAKNEHAADVTKIIIDGDHSVVDEVYVSMALSNWLQANLQRFTQVFATINIHRVVDQNEAFAWLKPTHVAYAFGYNAADPEKSVLGVLCQTGGRSAEGLIYQVQAEAIPPGSTAGYVISKARYLRDMLAPALPRAFDGLKAKTIKVNSDDSGLKINKPAQLKDVESDGKKYSPKLTELEIALNETEIIVDSATKTKIFPGIYSVCVSTGYYAFGLINRKSGGKTLGYYATRDFKSANSTEKTKGAIITEIILGIIAAVAGLILTFVSFGSGSLIAIGLAVALVGSLGALTTMEVVELIRENDGPPVDLLVANATDAVTWATGSHFDPNVAGLNNALQIGGNYVEDPTIDTLKSSPAALSPQARFQARFTDRMKERTK